MALIQIFYLYFLALALAFLEVQVEGAHGWAKNLPCWRPQGQRWYARLYVKVMGGKELTGYHAAVFGFSLLILHLPYAWGLPWSRTAEALTLSQFFLFVVVWDFLWFIINPHYGLKKFRPNCISWHKRWLLGVPIDYWGGVLFSFLCYAIVVRQVGTVAYMGWFMMFGAYMDLLLLTMVISTIVRQYGAAKKRAPVK